MAKRLTSTLRPGDTLARISGDEFVILCEDLAAPEEAEGVAARMSSALGSPFALPGVDAQVSTSASVGIAFAGRGGRSAEQILSDADTAMYEAKRAGGAHHRVIDLGEQRAALETEQSFS